MSIRDPPCLPARRGSSDESASSPCSRISSRATCAWRPSPLFAEVQDRWGILFALSELTRLARLMGNVQRARSIGRRALAFARETGQQREISNALEDLALVDLGRRKVTRAEQLAREALKIDRAVGMKQGEAASLIILGECALLREQDNEAQTLLDDALTLYREIGDNSGIALALVHLSTLALRRHEEQAALALLKEAFALFESTQEQQGIAVVLEHLAALCAATGQPERCRTLAHRTQADRSRPAACPGRFELSCFSSGLGRRLCLEHSRGRCGGPGVLRPRAHRSVRWRTNQAQPTHSAGG